MQKIMLKNPVFLKDISIKAKRSRMAVSLFILNVLASLIFILILLVSNSSMAEFSHMDLQAFTWIFDGFIIVECAFVCLMVPSEAGPSIANERERQTLDVLLTTKMSNFDIILGKYLSSVAYTLLLLISLLPFLSVVLIYGSISFFQLLAVMLAVIETVMYLSAYGIFFSTVVKKSSRASACVLSMVFLLVFGTVILCTITRLISVTTSNSYYFGNYFKENLFNTGDYSFFILYLNPATTVFDVLDKIVGFNAFSGSFNGMAGIIEHTADFLSPKSFFVKHWAPIGFVIQIIVSFYLLRLSAAKLNNTTRRVKRGKKNNN
ncbi:MAG: ABC transporter permease [Lachnospiraceae bacterium]|nr:ABC transporter permease [Lachnospiraceae bacterium]